MCTGRTWFTVAPTIRHELTGTKPALVSGKDIFPHIAGSYGDATNHNLEFGGPGLASVPMNDRRTVATQAAEVSADFATFAADDARREFLDAHTDRPYTPADADPDADYADVRRIDLSALVPHVARPGAVSRNAVPVTEVERRAVDQCFLGSCANGQLEDLRIAADTVRGRTVAPGVRMLVTPTSQAVYRDALKLGYVEAGPRGLPARRRAAGRRAAGRRDPGRRQRVKRPSQRRARGRVSGGLLTVLRPGRDGVHSSR
ncbi:MAG TPA: aconitase family protein [Pseudonocardia sp.]